MKTQTSLNPATKLSINFKFSDSKVKYVGWLAILLMALMSFFFYLERTIILDAAYQTFNIIFYQKWGIEVSRFGAVMTKWPTYLGMNLGWDLDTILRAYSMAFIFYLAVLFGILQLLGNQRMAIVLLLFYTLLVSHTFFWIQSELLQGTAFTVFFFGLVLTWKPMKWYNIALTLPIIITIVFFHPLTFVPFFFLWFFFLFTKNMESGIWYWSIPVQAGLVLYYKLYLYPSNAYDASSFGLIERLNDELFPWPSYRNFFQFCMTDYYWFPILLVLILTFYIIKFRKYWLKLLLVLLVTAGYIIMINGSFPYGAEQFYIESFYQVLAVFVAIPLVFDVLPSFSWPKKYAAIVLSVLIVVSLGRIYLRRSTYKARLDWNLAMLEKTKSYPSTKFLINEKDIEMDKYLMAWGGAFETLLLSSRQSPDSTRTIYIFNDNSLTPQRQQKRKDFLTPFGDIPFQFKNGKYFNFQDTSTYILLDKEDLVEWK